MFFHKWIGGNCPIVSLLDAMLARRGECILSMSIQRDIRGIGVLLMISAVQGVMKCSMEMTS